MQILNCVRCGYEWASRKITRPDRCAKCTSPSWWEPKRVPKIKPDKQKIGRPTKYMVNVLNVGQIMTIPWGDNILSMKQSIAGYANRHGRSFELKSTTAGLKVKRLI